MEDPIRIVAKVHFNKGFSYVLSRKPLFLYSLDGGILWAEDDGIFSCFYHGLPTRSFQAFGGREFSLPLRIGGTIECNGQWWDGGARKLESLIGVELLNFTYGTVKALQDCYVYGGALISTQKLAALESEYEGPIYDYWDYEKVIKYNDMRTSLYRRIFKLEKDKKNLIAEVKKKHSLLTKEIP